MLGVGDEGGFCAGAVCCGGVALTLRVSDVVCVIPPAVATIVIGKLPVGAQFSAEIVSVLVKGGLVGADGLNPDTIQEEDGEPDKASETGGGEPDVVDTETVV